MSPIVVIGIDGMDWQVLEPLLPQLPNLREIARRGFAGEMESIFPPDSIPSWVSIFTGLDPGEHGILESIDYFKKGIKQFTVDTGAFRGRTFWDKAGAMGRKVIVVNPLLAHPPWKVNGLMASGPVFISGEAAVWPEALGERISLPPLSEESSIFLRGASLASSPRRARPKPKESSIPRRGSSRASHGISRS